MDLQHLRKVVRIGEEIFAAFGCPTGQAAPEEVEDFTPAASANGVPEKVDLRKVTNILFVRNWIGGNPVYLCFWIMVLEQMWFVEGSIEC